MSGNETPTRGHIQINNVSKIYDPDGAKVLAVDRCTMDIAPGEFCVVVGPSGCGKTTLLNAIAGFHSISSGEILLDGEVLCSADKQAQPGSDRIVVFQNGALFPWFTVLENVTFGPIVQKAMRKEEAEDKAMEMLGQMGLMGIENNYPSEISSGMRRRVEIARAMMNNPRVLPPLHAPARRAVPGHGRPDQDRGAPVPASGVRQEQDHRLLHHARP